MSAGVSVQVWCDGPPSSEDGCPTDQMASLPIRTGDPASDIDELRYEASKDGWLHENNRDLCPGCGGEDFDEPGNDR